MPIKIRQLVQYWIDTLREIALYESRDVRLVSELTENRLSLERYQKVLERIESELKRLMGDDWMDSEEFMRNVVELDISHDIE